MLYRPELVSSFAIWKIRYCNPYVKPYSMIFQWTIVETDKNVRISDVYSDPIELL